MGRCWIYYIELVLSMTIIGFFFFDCFSSSILFSPYLLLSRLINSKARLLWRLLQERLSKSCFHWKTSPSSYLTINSLVESTIQKSFAFFWGKIIPFLEGYYKNPQTPVRVMANIILYVILVFLHQKILRYGVIRAQGLNDPALVFSFHSCLSTAAVWSYVLVGRRRES